MKEIMINRKNKFRVISLIKKLVKSRVTLFKKEFENTRLTLYKQEFKKKHCVPFSLDAVSGEVKKELFDGVSYKKKRSLREKISSFNTLDITLYSLGDDVIMVGTIKKNIKNYSAIRKSAEIINKESTLLSSEKKSNYFHTIFHYLPLPEKPYRKIHKIILLKSEKEPDLHLDKKILEEREVDNTVHLFHGDQYGFIHRSLLTPEEIQQYLYFRQYYLIRNTHELSEHDLLCKYIGDEELKKDFVKGVTQLDLIKLDQNKWKQILDSLFMSTPPSCDESKKNYYFCLLQLAKMRLHQAIEFQEKFDQVSRRIYTGDLFNKPESLNSGFVIISHHNNNIKEIGEKHDYFLNNFLYEKKLKGCVVLVFLPYVSKKIETCQAHNDKEEPSYQVAWFAFGADRLDRIDE